MTHFNLERGILEWRKRFAHGGIYSAAALDELEDHLREEIEQQIRAGATEESAYHAAVARMGPTDALKTEFAKLKEKEGWSKLLRICYWIFPTGVLLINTWTLLEYELTSLEKIVGGCVLLGFCVYMMSLPHLLRSLSAGRVTQFARVLKGAANFLWFWPAWVLLEASKLTPWKMGLVAALVLWCLYAAIAMTCVVYGLIYRCQEAGDGGSPRGQPRTKPFLPTGPSLLDVGVSPKFIRSFDSVARHALEAAYEEASRLGHDYIGTEHVLLGMLKCATGAFRQRLGELHLDYEAARVEIDRIVLAGSSHPGSSAVVFTPRARKALRLAVVEAKKSDESCIRSEHILLGLLLEGSGVAGQVLRELGLRARPTRRAIFS